jgi:hypothetical protein
MAVVLLSPGERKRRRVMHDYDSLLKMASSSAPEPSESTYAPKCELPSGRLLVEGCARES